MAGNRYARFFAICRSHGLVKEEVVLDFTGGRTSSLSALSDGEFNEMMIRLSRLQPPPREWSPPPGDLQRKKLIAIAGKMNWGESTIEIVGRLNVFLQEKYGKELSQFNVEELNRIVWVFENKIYTSYLKTI